MERVNYANKKVLVIEDMAEMRSSVRSILAKLGVTDIDTAVSGDDGIDKLKVKSYNLVLCDYDLGRGKDGQQVLEECRHGHLLTAQAGFILVTAAQTIESVMGALEYEPDGYITKPFTMEILSSRLTKILQKKLAFEPINKLIDEGLLKDAINACDKLLQEHPKLIISISRIKANLLLSLEEYDQSLALFEALNNMRPLEWAKLGIAKCLFYKEDYDGSEALLLELTNASNRHVEAWDWLAKIRVLRGEYDKALDTLKQAVERSPKAILRQQELARVAKETGNVDIATLANRKSVSLGKHSCYNDAQNYLDLSEILQAKLGGSSVREKTYATTEIINTLKSARTEFASDNEVCVKSHLLEGTTYKNLDRAEQAKMSGLKAVALFLTDPAVLGKNLAKDIINLLNIVGAEEEASDFQGNSAVSSLMSDEESAEITQALESKKRNDHIDKIEVTNNRGVELFEQGRFGAAIEMFLTAAEDPLANDSILLNLVQALIMDAKKNKKLKKQRIKTCTRFIERLDEIEIDEARVNRHQKLKSMYLEML